MPIKQLAVLAFCAAIICGSASAQSKAHGPYPRAIPNWISYNDVALASPDAPKKGRLVYSLDIDARGRVTNCTITESSGSPAVDAKVCRLLTRRVRLMAARDENGNKISGTWGTAFSWGW